MEHDTLQVVGAGPAGLASAIVAARSGRKVVVREMRRKVGARFHGDFQGLENWSSPNDVLEEFRAAGIDPAFEATPVFEQVCFGPDGRRHWFQSSKPFYYLVRRGPYPGTVDTALLQQALDLGVEVRFGETVHVPPKGALAASGPRRVNAVAVGLLFETDLADGAYACLGAAFAPGGYGYLLVNRGRATLGSCIFRDFQRADHYLQQTLQLFRNRLSFEMRGARRFGGYGNVFWSAPAGEEVRIGEASGVQDALWGFGIRLAVQAGVLAARLGSDPHTFARAWEDRFGRRLRTSFVNRFWLDRAGDFAYRWLLWRLRRHQKPVQVLQDLYSPAAWKLALFPLIRHRVTAYGRAAAGCAGTD